MNTLTLAVAGGRKTQGIVDACAVAPAGHHALILTYTTANQDSLISRLAPHRPSAAQIDVAGWFAFLLAHWVRPYLPTIFPEQRLGGMQFEGDGGRYATGPARFFNSEGQVYRRQLATLAVKINEASDGAVLDRLGRIYDCIWIDEVQDLNGYDLVILEQLMESGITIRMVGDVRQAILHTNVQDPKYPKYRGVGIKDWFDVQVKAGRLTIEHQTSTWRCHQTIATLADSIFGPEWGFQPTVSQNSTPAAHHGVYAVHPDHAFAYIGAHDPLCLRYSANSAQSIDVPFTNIGVAKGLEREHVLIAPTAAMLKFLTAGSSLPAGTACSLYVALTRARSSVAILTDKPEASSYPVWAP